MEEADEKRVAEDSLNIPSFDPQKEATPSAKPVQVQDSESSLTSDNVHQGQRRFQEQENSSKSLPSQTSSLPSTLDTNLNPETNLTLKTDSVSSDTKNTESHPPVSTPTHPGSLIEKGNDEVIMYSETKAGNLDDVGAQSQGVDGNEVDSGIRSENNESFSKDLASEDSHQTDNPEENPSSSLNIKQVEPSNNSTNVAVNDDIKNNGSCQEEEVAKEYVDQTMTSMENPTSMNMELSGAPSEPNNKSNCSSINKVVDDMECDESSSHSGEVENESFKKPTNSKENTVSLNPEQCKPEVSNDSPNNSLGEFANNKQSKEIIPSESLSTAPDVVEKNMTNSDKESDNKDDNSVPLPPMGSETLISLPLEVNNEPSEPLMSVIKNTPDSYLMVVNENPNSITSNTNDNSESREELHSSCVADTLLSNNSNGRDNPLLNKEGDKLTSVSIDAAATLHSLEHSVENFDSSMSENDLITSQEMPSEASSKEESTIFEVPLVIETPIALHSSDEAKFENELTLLEKESLDAAIEIETTQAEDALSNQCIIHENIVNSEHQVVKTNTISDMSRNSHDSDTEVVNETSSDDNDEDIDLHQSKKDLSFVPTPEEEMEDENRNENEEFNKLWYSINSQPSPETAIMEEVEDEFLKDLDHEVSNFEEKQIEETSSDVLKSQDANIVEKIICSEVVAENADPSASNENNSSSKDDKCEEDISKIAAFIHETSNTTVGKSSPNTTVSKSSSNSTDIKSSSNTIDSKSSSNTIDSKSSSNTIDSKSSSETSKVKKPLKIKLANRVGRPPNRVGRPQKRAGKLSNHASGPPKRLGKNPNRVGRPPNRLSKLRKKRGRPPTALKSIVKIDSEPPNIKELSSVAPTESNIAVKKDKIVSPEPVIRTYESDWRKIMRMKDNSYDKFVDQIFYTSNFPGTIPYIPRLYNNISKSCADSLSSWDVEKLQCPACPDSFLIPTSFFQHLYRKSCEIMFKCKLCDDVLTFFNRCALKVHFLSHMELDSGVSSIDIDHALLRPPRGMEHIYQTNHNFLESFSKELFNKDKTQCSECRLCIDNLLPHMTKKHKNVFKCKVCPMILPNPCSLSCHSRLHQGIGPFICPECGDEFQTLSIFKEHVLDFCLHEHRTLIYTCPLRHKEKKNFALNPSNLLEHISEHHVKLLYKCSYCSRAFMKENSIHLHFKEEHSNIPEYLTEKENFTLLYKTLIAKEKRIFGRKESFETAFLMVVEKQWKYDFFFKCPACNELFKDKENLREHGIQWCRLQKSDSGVAFSTFPMLFPLEKENNLSLPTSSHGNENFCNKENCLKCTKIFDLIQKHKHECLSGDNEGNEPIESYSDIERPISPSHKTTRSRLRSTYISEEVSVFSKSGSEFNEEEEEIDVNDEPASAPRKRGRKPKVKPLVEVLGLNVPSSKSILHFNRLHKQAMSLGSTVLPKRMRTSLHNCSLCDYKSNDRLSFLAHIKEHSEKYDSSSNSFLQCKECGMSFASEPSWKKHLFLIHRIRHPAPSDYLTDLTHLDEDSGDRRLVIDEDRANVCQVCSRSFESPKDLKKHSRGHGVSPLVSQNRKRSFTST